MQLGQLLSQASLVLQRERGTRLVRSRTGRHGREILRGGIRRCSVASRRRELESASLALERDDRTGGRKRRRQAGHEPARHLGGQRCAAERVRELAALPREAAAFLGFPPRTQQEPPDEAEHGRSSGREQCEREHQPVPSRREHIRAWAVDRNRPARNLRGGEDHEMIAALVQSAHAREQADLILRSCRCRAALRGRAKPASSSRPRLSSTTRPVKPRSDEPLCTRNPSTNSAPVSTPVACPSASVVGTAITRMRRCVRREAMPSLTNGAPVAMTVLK